MKALHSAGWLAHLQRNSTAARTLLEESLAIADERADDWWRAWVVHGLGRVAYFENDAPRAAELAQRSLTIAEPLGDAWLIAWTVHLLGLTAYIGGDYATANAHYERCLAMRRELGHLEGLLIVLLLKAMAAFRLRSIQRGISAHSRSARHRAATQLHLVLHCRAPDLCQPRR